MSSAFPPPFSFSFLNDLVTFTTRAGKLFTKKFSRNFGRRSMKSLWAGRSVSTRVGDPLKANPPKQRPPPPVSTSPSFSHSKRKHTLPCGEFLRSACVAVSPSLSGVGDATVWPPCPFIAPLSYFLSLYDLQKTLVPPGLGSCTQRGAGKVLEGQIRRVCQQDEV